MTVKIETDVCILGGGIAGLWLLNKLTKLGYRTLLAESGTLGGGQTNKSQGIIHGGTKYTLSGTLTQAAQCIGDMPRRWKECLNGNNDPDLQQVKVLSPTHYLWSPGDIGSRLTSFFASKALRSRVKSLEKNELPEIFQQSQFNGQVYQLNELVLDTNSLLEQLCSKVKDKLIKIDWQAGTKLVSDGKKINHLEICQNNQTYEIHSKRFILSAGEGNETLLQSWGIGEPKMQRRPLHMVAMKTDYPHPLYAHCLGMQMLPRLTVTCHPTEEGKWVWYLGGELAESGLKRSTKDQINFARKELSKLLPWMDLSQSQWATLTVNRAEPKQNNWLRPDTAYCTSHANGIVTWPTKLALAPNLADQILEKLKKDTVLPEKNLKLCLPLELERPQISQPFWQELF